jgi:hypothetical protein
VTVNVENDSRTKWKSIVVFDSPRWRVGWGTSKGRAGRSRDSSAVRPAPTSLRSIYTVVYADIQEYTALSEYDDGVLSSLSCEFCVLVSRLTT